MRSPNRLAAAFVLLIAPLTTAAEEGSGKGVETDFRSPRLRQLRTAIEAGNRSALESFWAELRKTGPLIEEIPGVADELLVSFVWRADSATHRVDLYGGLPAARYYPWSKDLLRMPRTDLWYRTERMPSDARFQYAFHVNAPYVDFLSEEDLNAYEKRYPWQRDPFNPQVIVGESYLELRDALAQPYLTPLPGVPRGSVRKDSLRSAILSEARQVTIHLPAQPDPATSYPLLVVFDGEWFGSVEPAPIPLPVILDNLVAQGKVPPMVTVLVDNQGTRHRDLTNSTAFADFLAKELVPWLRSKYRLTEDPARVIAAGLSNGGLAAGYAALQYSGTFGNVLALAGWWAHDENNYASNFFTTPTYRSDPGWIMRQYAARPRLPIRFYLDVGRFDVYTSNNLRMNRHMRDVLTAKGYPLVYREYNSGHDFVAWRGTVADGLVALTADWPR